VLAPAAAALDCAAPALPPAAEKPNGKLADDDPALPVVNPKVEGLLPISETAGVNKEGAGVPFDGAAPNLNAAALELELVESAPKRMGGAFDFDESDPKEKAGPLDALAPNNTAAGLFPSAPASEAFESTPNLNPPPASAPNLNPCVADDSAPAEATPKLKLPSEAAEEVAPNWNWGGATEGAAEDGAAPGFGVSQDKHFCPASGLFRDLQTSHRHSPGLGLNISARDGKPALAPLAGADVAAFGPEAAEETTGAFTKPSSSSSSLLPDGSSETSTFLVGH
jgi:hypothetical protein